MVRMIHDGVRNWPSWVPDIDRMAREGGPQGAEALYLLAQINERYLDWEAAAAAYAAMWDLYPTVRGSQVPAHLLDACTHRIDGLARDSRDAELVAVYENCWREPLAEHVTSVSMFEAASRAFERLGLSEDALAVQLDLTTVLASVGREDPLQLARLALLNLAAERPEEALDTVRYGRLLATTSVQRASLDVAEGETLLEMGRLEEGFAALRRAAADPTVRATALQRVGVAQLRLGQCDAGLAALGPALVGAPLPDTSPGDVELLALRCAVNLERGPEALVLADLAIRRSQDEWTPKEARWLATFVGRHGGLDIPAELRSEEPILEAIRGEDATHAAFLAEIAEWERGAAR
jgi:tetratricopeptide (TPR) repeat protein